jgi:putative membrane protein
VSILERIAVTWIGNILALWAAALLVGDIDASGFGTLVLAAAVFGLVNAFVKPVVKLLGCALIVLTFGVALFFINMAMFALTAWIVPGFDVGGFWSVAGGAVIIWLVNVAINFGLDRLGLRDGRREPLGR